jgi:hypothetical protein
MKKVYKCSATTARISVKPCSNNLTNQALKKP